MGADNLLLLTQNPILPTDEIFEIDKSMKISTFEIWTTTGLFLLTEN